MKSLRQTDPVRMLHFAALNGTAINGGADADCIGQIGLNNDRTDSYHSSCFRLVLAVQHVDFADGGDDADAVCRLGLFAVGPA